MKTRSFSFLSLTLIGGIVAVIHFLANEHFLYWEWWWLDVVMHFLGGNFIASLFAWFYISLRETIPSRAAILYAVFLVAVLWELFEFMTGMMDTTIPGYVFDTVSDTILGILGAYIFSILLFRNEEKTKTP